MNCVVISNTIFTLCIIFVLNLTPFPYKPNPILLTTICERSTTPATSPPHVAPPPHSLCVFQTFKANHLQNNAESQISAMAYLDLILRAVTEPGLLRSFVRFLLDADKFDGQRILDVLVERISSPDTRVRDIYGVILITLKFKIEVYFR